MNLKPLVSIIVPTYHDWDRLLVCLKALEDQTYSKKDYEVIIVNNDPKDSVPKNYFLQDNFVIINEAEVGSYAARNAALKLAKGDIIGFTDSDCIPEPNWIEAAINLFDNRPEIDRIAGKVELFISGEKYTLAEAYEVVYAFRQEENARFGKSVTANMFAKKRVFDVVGLFNSTMISGGDFEWGIRAASYDFKIAFAYNVIVKHPARKKLNQLINKTKRVTSGKANLGRSNTWFGSTLFQFIYDIRPPVNEFRHIYNRGKRFGFIMKLLIFFLRYHIRVVRAYEEVKLLYGARPFNDIQFYRD